MVHHSLNAENDLIKITKRAKHRTPDQRLAAVAAGAQAALWACVCVCAGVFEHGPPDTSSMLAAHVKCFTQITHADYVSTDDGSASASASAFVLMVAVH